MALIIFCYENPCLVPNKAVLGWFLRAEFHPDTHLFGQLLAINTWPNEYEHTQKYLEHSGKAKQGAITPKMAGIYTQLLLSIIHSISVLIYAYKVNVVSKVASYDFTLLFAFSEIPNTNYWNRVWTQEQYWTYWKFTFVDHHILLIFFEKFSLASYIAYLSLWLIFNEISHVLNFKYNYT